jgi:hypothetical protein
MLSGYGGEVTVLFPLDHQKSLIMAKQQGEEV